MSVNKVILIGNLGVDPELKVTNSQMSVSNLRVATHEKFTNAQGEKVESTEWHTIVVFGKLADNCAKYLSKGSKIFVEGKLKTRKWTDKDGHEKYSTEVVANTIEFLDSVQNRTATPQPQPQPQGQGQGPTNW